MLCPDCHSELTRGKKGWFCEDCTALFSFDDPRLSERGSAFQKAIHGLPHPLALLLSEYSEETDPYIRLHRLCDAGEMGARFLTAVALAEVERHFENGLRSEDLPAGLRDAILTGIEGPTFGQWMRLLRESVAALEEKAGLLLPELGRTALALKTSAARMPIRREPTCCPCATSWLTMPGFPRTRPRQFLDDHGHAARLEQWVLESLAPCLEHTELFGVDKDGQWRQIMGSAIGTEIGNPPDGLSLELGPGDVALVRRDPWTGFG